MDNPLQISTLVQQELTALRQRIAILEALESTVPVVATTSQYSLEALQVAGEELRQQNAELLETRQTLEVVRAHYEALFALAPEGYVVTNVMGIIQEANHTAAALLDMPPEELVGKPLLIFIVKHDRKAFHTQMSRVMRHKRVYAWEIHIQPHGGQPFPADITIAVSQSVQGMKDTLLWLLRDLTERKQLEEELRHAEHLTLLGTLAASVAHEIRNPLSAVFLNMDLLQEELQQLPAALHAPMLESLAEVKTGLAHMHDIVEDYLSLARLEHLQRVSVDFGAFLATFAEEIQPSCAPCGITLCLEVATALGKVWLHQSAFRRAVLNLVQNAIEAMPPGGTLTLRGQHTATHLTLEVRDTGRGIPAEQLPLLFTPLHTTKPQGTGLGLYVVQEIIAAHGGTLTVQSEPGRGTTFTITLPREDESRP
jgi:two-component system, OmpR family, sensor histidine kinase VicK